MDCRAGVASCLRLAACQRQAQGGAVMDEEAARSGRGHQPALAGAFVLASALRSGPRLPGNGSPAWRRDPDLDRPF